MPRTSPYSITLAEAERADLEARARRYTSPYSDVVRARIVLYAADGLANDEIAARLDTPTAGGVQVAQTLPRRASGRPDRSASGSTAPEFFPLTSWSLSRRWPANCPRSRTRRRRVRHRRLDLGHHHLALAEFGCDQALAASVLDLPPRPRLRCQGGPGARPLRPPLRRHRTAADEFVISADEKTSIQARIRKHATTPPAPR